MVTAACARGVDARVGDIRAWAPPPGVGVIVSNAALQWVPDHAELMVRWVEQCAPGTWLAVQVPGNAQAPSHVALRQVMSQQPWSALLSDKPLELGKNVQAPQRYAEMLIDARCRVDVWESTYFHELTGEHPVVDWMSGTTLTPVRDELNDELWQRFRSELIPVVAQAYPKRSDGRVFYPFRRIFIVAEVLAESAEGAESGVL